MPLFLPTPKLSRGVLSLLLLALFCGSVIARAENQDSSKLPANDPAKEYILRADALKSLKGAALLGNPAIRKKVAGLYMQALFLAVSAGGKSSANDLERQTAAHDIAQLYTKPGADEDELYDLAFAAVSKASPRSDQEQEDDIKNLLQLVNLQLLALQTQQIKAAKAAFLASFPALGEAARAQYMRELVAIHDSIIVEKGIGWVPARESRASALEQEISKYPAPPDSDSRALSKLRAGRWVSPRHDYLYRRDGTWTMLPEEDDTSGGHWSIQGNRYFDGGQFTILLLNHSDFVFTDTHGSSGAFYEKRVAKDVSIKPGWYGRRRSLSAPPCLCRSSWLQQQSLNCACLSR